MQIWFLVAAAAINLLLALMVFTKIRTSAAIAYFAISAIFIVVWAIGTLGMLFGSTPEIVYFGLILFLVAPMATALYMVLFAKNFANVNYPSGQFGTLLFVGIMVGVAIYTILNIPTSDVIVAINVTDQNVLNFQHPWFMVYSSYFSSVFCIAYVYLLIGLYRSKGQARKQLLYVFLGLFLTSFLALITNIILPIFGQSSFVWLGPSWTIFYILTTSFSMARHRLFDIRFALVLAFTYILSLAALAAIYFTVAFAISALFFKDQQVSNTNGFIQVSLALLLAFLFQPIRGFFDKLTNRIFFRGTYNVDDFVARLGAKLNTTNDLRLLLQRATTEIADTLKAQHGMLVVHYGKHFISDGSKQHLHLPVDDIAELNAYVSEFGDEVINKNELPEGSSMRRLLTSHRITIVMPLTRGELVVAYLLLGAHRAGNYSNRDLKTLTIIRDELVIAIQNALSIQEVRELNATLQQRIDSATKELRTSNAQLQRLDKAKDEFVSMASHQLRTPLTSVKGYISMVVEGDVGKISDSQKHLLEEAFNSSERMVHLINDFLNVSRLQTGKFLIEKHPIDLSKVVEQELDSLTTNAASRDLKFTYVVPKHFPILNIDEGKIRQVIMNFADNSLYYSKEGTHITVKLAIESEDVVFTVKDTGIGVPRTEQSQLFSKFYRASNARKQRPDGTGVGLFLAKKVIDAHGGHVVFESIEGKGSTFGFRLPLAKLRVSDTDKLDN